MIISVSYNLTIVFFCLGRITARNLINIVMTKEEFITERTRIISEMLDNPDENGIYPTTKCFEQLDELFDKIVDGK